MIWKTIERPGYLGKKRDEIEALWNDNYGKGAWRIAYEWGSEIIPRKEALQIYEDGYYEHLKKSPAILSWLIMAASDIYDTAPSNIESKYDYDHQETPNNHVHDIAVRRSVLRLGKAFRGKHLLQIRSCDPEGKILGPGVVPFHLPEMISKEPIKDYGKKSMWWKPNSIEDFYQRNKLLQVKKVA